MAIGLRGHNGQESRKSDRGNLQYYRWLTLRNLGAQPETFLARRECIVGELFWDPCSTILQHDCFVVSSSIFPATWRFFVFDVRPRQKRRPPSLPSMVTASSSNQLRLLLVIDRPSMLGCASTAKLARGYQVLRTYQLYHLPFEDTF